MWEKITWKKLERLLCRVFVSFQILIKTLKYWYDTFSKITENIHNKFIKTNTVDNINYNAFGSNIL